jgi:hypothetical protein
MYKLLRYLSWLCCAFVIVSFFLFAVTQTSHASAGQASAVTTGAVSAGPQKSRPIAREGQPRRLIDQVAQKLNSPFTGIVSTDNRWIERLLPTLFSLLVYGLALSYLARWAAGRPTALY